MTEPIIEAEGLVKWFGKVEALAGLDLLARSGQVTAVLGPNGAGKTTFVASMTPATRLTSSSSCLRCGAVSLNGSLRPV